MRKLINSTYITLDGVIENPMWSMPYFDGEFAESQTRAADALLMGRVTYEGFAAVWPTMDESDPSTGAAYFNSVKKYVASTTLTDPEWNNSEVLDGDLVEAVTKLKASEGGDILQYGFGPVTARLIEAGLVDEVAMDVAPVVLGSGKRYFGSVDAQHLLEDPDVVIQGNRVLHLRYRVRR